MAATGNAGVAERAALAERFAARTQVEVVERVPGSSFQFLVRRTAQHVMDHAWEMEDRDLS